MENEERILQSIKITLATPEDEPELQKLIRESWLATFPNEQLGVHPEHIEEHFDNPSPGDPLMSMKEYTKPLPLVDIKFVAKQGGKIVGLCRIQEFPEENKLAGFYVLPGLEGRGIGRDLWKEAQTTLNPSKDTVLWVAEYNTNAINVYRNFGFAETEEQEERRLNTNEPITRTVMKMRKLASL